MAGQGDTAKEAQFPFMPPFGTFGETSGKSPKELLQDDDGDDDDDLDETLAERLWGLTEMFPERVQNATSKITYGSWSGLKWLYTNTRSLTWVLGSSAMILFLPVMFESERSQMEEMQMQQQRQVLLGPNAAVSASKGLQPQLMPQPVQN